jgi:hypothetical protein
MREGSLKIVVGQLARMQGSIKQHQAANPPAASLLGVAAAVPSSRDFRRTAG